MQNFPHDLDLENKKLVKIVCDRSVFKECPQLVAEVAQLKGLETVDIYKLAPNDPDMIVVLESHANERSLLGNHTAHGLGFVPKGSRIVYGDVSLEDYLYNEEHLFVLNSDDEIFTV